MLKFLSLRRLCEITTLLVIFQLAFAQAMAASPEFHHACEGHSGDPGHECLVTMMLNGGYALVIPDIEPVDTSPETPPAEVVSLSGIDLLPSHLTGGVLAHAPPRGP